MSIKYKYLFALLLFFFSILSSNSYAASAEINNENFIKGKLENGLTYYILQNKTEDSKACFYLVQNVGSLMEEDNQRGLAHFLEHMAFNASLNFPGGIDKFFIRNKIDDYNAFTDQNETVYNIDNVNIKNQLLLDSCMLVLKDWCHSLTFPETGIEKERGIILEEWRMRRDAMGRARDKMLHLLYNNSRYSTRNPIGELSILENFQREELVKYYDEWYRPDLQAIIIIGDINKDYVERFVKDNFSEIPMPENAQVRPQYLIDDHDDSKYISITDKEFDSSAIEISQRIKDNNRSKNKQELFKKVTQRKSFVSMMNNRLATVIEKNKEDIIDAAVGFDIHLRDYYNYSITISPQPKKDYKAVYKIFEAIETVKKNGFTQNELDNYKKSFQREIEGMKRELLKLKNSDYVDAFQNNYLNSSIIVFPNEFPDLIQSTIDNLSISDIKQWIDDKLKNEDNRIFIVIGNDDKYEYLRLDDFLFAEEDIKDSELPQIELGLTNSSLVDFDIKEGKLINEKKTPYEDSYVWTFDNGAKVYFKKNNDGNNEVNLYAESKGGISLLDKNDIPSAEAVPSLAFASGVYNINRFQMVELMQNYSVEINYSLQKFGESINAVSDKDDIESLFELLYLSQHYPRFDESELDHYKNDLAINYISRNKIDLDFVNDSIRMLTGGSSELISKIDSSYISKIQLENVDRIFKERFCNASDFIFYIVGDINYEDAKYYASKYIATLPAKGNSKKENYKFKDIKKNLEDVKKEFLVDLPDNKSLINIKFSDNNTLSKKESSALWLLGIVLKSRCYDEIREKRGGTYAINVDTRYNKFNDPKQNLDISFETSSEKLDEMKQAVYQEVDDICYYGITSEDIKSIIPQMIEYINTQERDNKYWIKALTTYHLEGNDYTKPGYRTDALEALNVKNVNKAVKKFFKSARKSEFIIKAK